MRIDYKCLMTVKKHGGVRPGSGRPKLPDGEKKRPTNITLPPSVLVDAREKNINISATCTIALVEAIAAQESSAE